MQKKLGIMVILSSLVVFLMILPACSKKQTEPAPVPPPPPQEEPPAQIDQEAEARQKMEAEEAELRAGKIKFMYEDVYFKKGSYRLDAEAETILTRKAEWLRNHPNIKVIIEGHTNNRGAKEYNFALGDRRAGEVKSFLIKAGIATERLIAVSYGNERPIDPGKTEAAKAKNRRVHFDFE